MITETEFVAIKAFDRTLFSSVDSAQRIINAKNGQLISHSRTIAVQAQRIANLEAALAGERKKTQALATQLQRFMAMH